MSTRFVVVKEEPKDLPKGTTVIRSPDFMEEIVANKSREPRGGHTAATHLRYIVGSIGQNYDPELSAYTVRPHLFEGRKYDNDQELSKIVLEMLKSQYPQVFDRYLECKIRARPPNVKLIYYVGNFGNSTAFFTNGIDVIDEKDVDVLLGIKSKKVVGKPAITDEEANTKTEQQ